MVRRSTGLCRAWGALAALMGALSCVVANTAYANGRVPGATGLAIDPTDDKHLLLGLTYGLALTRDGGASWTWMCEQQIEGNGGDVDPSIVVPGDGTILVISLTNGGVLLSQDGGCSFERAAGPLKGKRGVDLTLDTGRKGHVLALMATVGEVGDAGYVSFHNFLAHSLDYGRTWEVLSELPGDMLVETVEVAPSDSNRIYVSGTASANPVQGIVERSDDGGRNWKRATVDLPRGSGSLYVSGIHPTDPDRVWFRVPGRGDIYGLLPARLWLSTDGALKFQPVAETKGGMLGFAVSPRGDRVVYGGPLDGLFVAPADASAEPAQISDQEVSCARWHENGLYVCMIEPKSMYTLGFTKDPMQPIAPLWQRADTCRDACTPSSTLAGNCQEPWEDVAPYIGADNAICGGGAPQNVPSAMPEMSLDAGSAVRSTAADGGSRGNLDAAVMTSAPAGTKASSGGCTVTSVRSVGLVWWLTALPMLLVWARRRRRFGAR